MKKNALKNRSLNQIKTLPKQSTITADIVANPLLQKHLGFCLYKVAMKFRALVDAVLAEENLVAPQFGMLNLIRASQGINQMTLGLQMGQDKATVVKLIDGLEKRGFVIRETSTTDRREKFLKITSKGIKYLEEITPALKVVENDFLEPLTAEEKRVFVKCIPKLMQPK